MLSLSRSLFDDLFSLPRELDNLFERSWDSPSGLLPEFRGQATNFLPEVECYIKDGNIVYRMAIPGIDPKNVDLSIVGNQLTVKGERTTPGNVKDDDWYIRGFRYGHFERTFTLPEGVEREKVSANFANGMLEISVPLAKAQRPRKITIKQLTGEEEQAKLEAKA
jgi:HSP20 family protein